MKLISKRLRRIEDADFRQSERTIFDEIAKKAPTLANIDADDENLIIVKSGSGKLVMYIHGWREVENARGEKRRVLVTEKHRLESGEWSDLMVANYAISHGFKLRGLPTLEEIVSKLRRAWSPT
jgi:hypothetical protein